MAATRAAQKKPFYTNLWVQVLFAIAIAVLFGYFSPARAIAMKPLGDGFIRLITMIIALMIFCTVVSGIAGMEDMKKVGRVGGKALLYFEIVSTVALLMAWWSATWCIRVAVQVNPRRWMPKRSPITPGRPRRKALPTFCCTSFPRPWWTRSRRAISSRSLLVALLFGFALSVAGSAMQTGGRSRSTALTHAVFGVINILMRLAPIGAFGAMAFTVGKYGVASLGPLAKLIATFYITCILFVLVVFGRGGWLAGFSIIKFLMYIKEEILLVLAVSSSEPACRR